MKTKRRIPKKHPAVYFSLQSNDEKKELFSFCHSKIIRISRMHFIKFLILDAQFCLYLKEIEEMRRENEKKNQRVV